LTEFGQKLNEFFIDNLDLHGDDKLGDRSLDKVHYINDVRDYVINNWGSIKETQSDLTGDDPLITTIQHLKNHIEYVASENGYSLGGGYFNKDYLKEMIKSECEKKLAELERAKNEKRNGWVYGKNDEIVIPPKGHGDGGGGGGFCCNRDDDNDGSVLLVLPVTVKLSIFCCHGNFLILSSLTCLGGSTGSGFNIKSQQLSVCASYHVCGIYCIWAAFLFLGRVVVLDTAALDVVVLDTAEALNVDDTAFVDNNVAAAADAADAVDVVDELLDILLLLDATVVDIEADVADCDTTAFLFSLLLSFFLLSFLLLFLLLLLLLLGLILSSSLFFFFLFLSKAAVALRFFLLLTTPGRRRFSITSFATDSSTGSITLPFGV